MIDPEDPVKARDEWIALMDRREAIFLTAFRKILRTAFAKAATRTPQAAAKDFQKALEKLLIKHYTQTARAVAVMMVQNTNRKHLASIETKGLLEDIVAGLVKLIAKTAFDRSQIITGTLRKRLRKALAEFTRHARDAETGRQVTRTETETADFLQQEMAKEGRRLSRNYARTVARTESSQASDMANDEAIKQFEKDGLRIVSTGWVSPNDPPRARVTHMALHLTEKPAGEDFNVGGFPAKRPRDKRLPAHEAINCRCLPYYNSEVIRQPR